MLHYSTKQGPQGILQTEGAKKFWGAKHVKNQEQGGFGIIVSTFWKLLGGINPL